MSELMKQVCYESALQWGGWLCLSECLSLCLFIISHYISSWTNNSMDWHITYMGFLGGGSMLTASGCSLNYWSNSNPHQEICSCKTCIVNNYRWNNRLFFSSIARERERAEREREIEGCGWKKDTVGWRKENEPICKYFNFYNRLPQEKIDWIHKYNCSTLLWFIILSSYHLGPAIYTYPFTMIT